MRARFLSVARYYKNIFDGFLATHHELLLFSKSKLWAKFLKNYSSKDVIFIASQIGKEFGWEAALRFVNKYASSELQNNASHLLRANLYLNDDEKWLEQLNAYLKYFNLSPVKLKENAGPRLTRLYSDVPVVHNRDLISIIMPVFNASETVNYAVNSILSQTWRNLELIIVDDCSSDGTFEIIQKLAKSDERIRILRNKVNVGPYVSKNLALRIVRGKYITGQDADDWSHPQRVEKDMEVISQSNQSIKAVISRMLPMRDSGEFSRFARVGSTSIDGAGRISSISLFIETDYFKKNLGSWDSVRFAADGELISRAKLLMGDALKIVPNIGMICLNHPSSLSNDKVHGVSDSTGKSSTRLYYTEAYQNWHSNLAKAKLDFPLLNRVFMAPSVMQVPKHDAEINISEHDKQLLR